MRTPTNHRVLSSAWLLALFVAAVPATSLRAQRGPVTRAPRADALGSGPPVAPDRLEPYRLRLGLAPDDATYARDLPTPALSSLRLGQARVIRVGPRSARDAAAVACPMPVARMDSSAVPAMPRVDPSRRDTGGVAPRSCVNPLDVR